MNLNRLRKEIWQSPYYRLHPFRVVRLLNAKRTFARRRVYDPLALLTNWGLDVSGVLDEFHRWRPLFEDTLARVESERGEQGAISIEDGLLLYAIIRIVRPQNVIETGVAAGVSTTFLGAALVDNGFGDLYSIELPPDEVCGIKQADGALFSWPESGVAWAVPSSIRRRIVGRHTLILKDVREALPELLRRLPSIEVFFHDDLHQPDHMLWEYELVWEHLRAGGFLISDDVNDGWLKFCRMHGVPEAARMNVQRLALVLKREH